MNELPRANADARRVTVFRERVLSGSETFIRNQLEAMQSWSPILLGLERVESALSRPTDQCAYRRAAGVRRRALKATGRSAALTAALRRTNPDLVHAHFGADASMTLNAVRRLGVPLVTTFHGIDVTVWPHRNDFMSRRYQARLPRLFEQADRLLAVSDFIASRLESLGAPESKIQVLPIGIPIPAQPDNLHGQRRGVLFVGRLMPVKGVDDALRAYASLDPEMRAAHPFTVIGEGPEKVRLRDLASRLGVQVSFLGARRPAEVAERMKNTAVLIGPSKTAADGAQEAFGMVFLEAAAACVPVVAYKSGGIGEAVVDGQTGMLAEEGDIAGLAHRLRRTLADEGIRNRFGAEARRRVVTDFDVRRQTTLLEAEYDRLSGRGDG